MVTSEVRFLATFLTKTKIKTKTKAMENKIKYAKKHLSTRLLNEVDGVQKLFIDSGKLYIEFANGMCVQLHDDEIDYQAINHLKSENTKPLENSEIIKHLLFDKEAYDEYVKEMLDRFLKDNPDEYTYWDAWFRKAEGEDMNKAAEGIPYVKTKLPNHSSII